MDVRSAPTLAAELARLDPWSFHVLPGEGFGVDSVVVGTTGSFAIRAVHEDAPAMVARRPPGHRGLRRAARRLERRLAELGLHTGAEAVLCSAGPTGFAPRTVRGVRVIPRVLLVRELAERQRILEPHQAQRAAQSLLRATA
jgi:Fe2+ transport system protein FeoA